MKKIVLLFSLLFSGFALAQFDYARAWGTYFGGYNFEYSCSAIDRDGNVYVGSRVSAQNSSTSYYNNPDNHFTTLGAHQTALLLDLSSQTVTNASFLAKFSPQGVLLWSTYIYSGFDYSNLSNISNSESIKAIRCDAQNNVYIYGSTVPSDHYNPNPNGLITQAPTTTINTRFYEAKFTPAGGQVYGKYIYQNTFGDGGFIIPVYDSLGNSYTIGSPSDSFVTLNAFDTTISTYAIEKRDPNGTLLWATYYGNNNDILTYYVIKIVVDASDNIYVTGTQLNPAGVVPSNYYATPNCFQSLNGAIPTANFAVANISKFSSQGQRLWSTYFGPPLSNGGLTLILNIQYYNNFLYIAGTTTATTGIASPGCFQNNKSGGAYVPFQSIDYNYISSDAKDGFLAKFDLNGNRVWGTYYGGELRDDISGLEIKNDKIFVAGNTLSTTNIATPGSYMENHSNSIPCPGCGAYYGTEGENTNKYDLFFAQFTLDGNRSWGSYFGGDRLEYIYSKTSLLLDNDNNIYLFGTTASDNGIATPGAFRTYRNYGAGVENGNFYDNATTNPFLVKFSPLPLGTQKNSLTNIKVYPNPSKNHLIIENETTISTIAVTTLLGQVVATKSCNDNIVQLDMSNLASGIYFIKITSQGLVKNVKVIKE